MARVTLVRLSNGNDAETKILTFQKPLSSRHWSTGDSGKGPPDKVRLFMENIRFKRGVISVSLRPPSTIQIRIVHARLIHWDHILPWIWQNVLKLTSGQFYLEQGDGQATELINGDSLNKKLRQLQKLKQPGRILLAPAQEWGRLILLNVSTVPLPLMAQAHSELANDTMRNLFIPASNFAEKAKISFFQASSAMRKIIGPLLALPGVTRVSNMLEGEYGLRVHYLDNATRSTAEPRVLAQLKKLFPDPESVEVEYAS